MALLYRGASNGYWVAFLLPIALSISDLKFERQSGLAVFLISFYAALLSFFHWMDVDILVMLQRLKRVHIASSVITVFYWVARGEGSLYYHVSSIALNFTFPYLFCNLIKHHPRSFTFGEGVLVTSAFAYNFWSASQSLPFAPSPIQEQTEPVLISLFLQGIFFVTILISRIFLLMQKPWKLYVLEEMFCLWSKYCIIAFISRMPIQTDEDVLWFLSFWPYNFLVATHQRVNLLIYWAVISTLTAIYVIYCNYYSRVTTTIDRKVFHFIIVAVFLPGIFKDHALIFCCSAVFFFIFMLIEAIRVLELELLGFKIGNTVNESVQIFRDHQDEGKLILTPIYLLVGCALPIWLTGLARESHNNLKTIEYSACMAGILSIGIGDTFASIGGTLYGRTYWKNSRKTVEGTVCSVIAQVMAASLIFTLGYVPYDEVSVIALIVGIMVNAIIEGKTDQIDNLVLPIITFIAVHSFKAVLT
ncbi:unnamed protein product [Orchesella dallaii]|uniref:dolichol kinase n=1 Tax=Orchesella dallaii TaxID=48710 RepID=A0ABP1QP05_9HEXA